MDRETQVVQNGDVMRNNNGLTCMKCQESERTFKILPCLHILCTDCLPAHVNKARSAAGCTALSMYTCPVCSYKVKNSADVSIERLLKDAPHFLHQRNKNASSDCATKVSGGNGYACAACNTEKHADELSFCQDCGEVICSGCIENDHGEHEMTNFSTWINSKSKYISGLVGEINGKMRRHEEKISCIDRVESHLASVKSEVENSIVERYRELVDMIEKRRDNLLRELESSLEKHCHSYDTIKDSFLSELKQFSFVGDFAKQLLDFGRGCDVLDYHDDVSNVCLRQLHQVPEAKVDVPFLKLEMPGKGKEQSALEKLFGSLTEGTVLVGSSEKVTSFPVDLKWPTSIAVSPSKEIVITGKTGAFESPGRAFFFDSRGRFHTQLEYDKQHVPLGVTSAGDGTLWMSNNRGQIRNMTVAGHVIRTVNNVFRGSGQIAALNNGDLAVASSVDNKLHILDEIGRFQRSLDVPFKTPENSKEDHKNGIRLTAVVTNSSDHLVIGDSTGGRIVTMDSTGSVLHYYPSPPLPEDENVEPLLKCPSSLCCDPFDNILVADFTNDSVHLFSHSGRFLGTLLTKDDGLSCPNCMSLDQEGNLYIGQYGGDIVIYRYMSYSKNA